MKRREGDNREWGDVVKRGEEEEEEMKRKG